MHYPILHRSANRRPRAPRTRHRARYPPSYPALAAAALLGGSMAVRSRPRWEARNQFMTQSFQHRVVALPHTRMDALPHPSQRRQSPATCPTHTASSAISTILPRPCGGGPTRRLDGGPQSTPLGSTQSTHDATVPTSSGCITPHADGFITPSFRWLLVSHDVPPGSLVKTPAPSRQPLSENEGGSIIPPQGKSRVAALPHT